MDALSYLKRANTHESLNPKDFLEQVKIAVVTNFTDSLLQKFLISISLENNIYPEIFAEPYKQYLFDLPNPQSKLYATDADITFIFFDTNSYISSEFSIDTAHLNEVLRGVETYAKTTRNRVIVSSFPLPYANAYGNLHSQDPFFMNVVSANEQLQELATQYTNISLLDSNRLIARFGEESVRDLRSLYAFDVPFTNDFLLSIAHEFMAYLLAMRGRSKKCIVVDLDNTLWGGVVGEVGTYGVALGPGYPGFVYQNFQHALLSYYNRGIILAIASRNNQSDVDEVFKSNKNMVLSRKHFANMQINWLPKSESLKKVAEELNIGLDSLVFIDDDPANREEVRAALPQVLVPEMPQHPEEFIDTLFSLTCFTQLALTDEDRQKGAMYVAERERTEVMSGDHDPIVYLDRLGIHIAVAENDEHTFPRIAQLTQKTNQFNLTTRRYTENDIERMRTSGALLFTAEVDDRFGSYGIVAIAIFVPGENGSCTLDTCLMSCRAMGRGVEFAFLDSVLEQVRKQGYTSVTAEYILTPKNTPARDFLKQMGFVTTNEESGRSTYSLDLSMYIAQKPTSVTNILPHLSVTTNFHV